MSGLFVVFEGGDSAGKSTQVRQLAAWLKHVHRPFLVTHEPGDSWLGGEIRRLVLSTDSGDISARAECLLYIADKAQHVVEVVQPALERGEVVVCDRYVDSTIAYQAAGRSLPADDVETIARWATQSLRPDLTVLLDVDPSQAVSRIAEKDRIESAGEDFHQRVRQGFLRLAERDPEHYLVLPARDTVDSIARRVRLRVSQLLEQNEGPTAGPLETTPTTMAEPVEAPEPLETTPTTMAEPLETTPTTMAEPVEAPEPLETTPTTMAEPVEAPEPLETTPTTMAEPVEAPEPAHPTRPIPTPTELARKLSDPSGTVEP